LLTFEHPAPLAQSRHGLERNLRTPSRKKLDELSVDN
jgi:hypothetical protein